MHLPDRENSEHAEPQQSEGHGERILATFEAVPVAVERTTYGNYSKN